MSVLRNRSKNTNNHNHGSNGTKSLNNTEYDSTISDSKEDYSPVPSSSDSDTKKTIFTHKKANRYLHDFISISSEQLNRLVKNAISDTPRNDINLLSNEIDNNELSNETFAGVSEDYENKGNGTSENGINGISRLNVLNGLNESNNLTNSNIYYHFGKEGGKKILFYELSIKRLSKIDTTDETFTCRFQVYLTWLSTLNEYLKYKNIQKNKNNFYHSVLDNSYKPDWVPSIEWMNSTGDSTPLNKDELFYDMRRFKKSNWHLNEKYIGFKPWDAYFNRVKYDFNIEFAEELELETFPFDCQELSMFLKIDRITHDKCDILPFPRIGKYINFDTEHTVVSEWDFKTILAEFGQTDPKSSKSGKIYPKVSVYIKVSRQWQASIGLILVVFCLFTLAVGIFSIKIIAGDPEVLGDQLGYAITLLLADVACNQLLYDNLPNIPYATLFDYYIYTSFVYIFVATSWTFMGGMLDLWFSGNDNNEHKTSLSHNFDLIVFIVFALIYLFTQLFFAFVSVKIRKYGLSTIEKFPFEIEENEDNLNYFVKIFIRGRNTAERGAISIDWDPSIHLAEDDYDTEEHDNTIFARAEMKPDDDDDNDD